MACPLRINTDLICLKKNDFSNISRAFYFSDGWNDLNFMPRPRDDAWHSWCTGDEETEFSLNWFACLCCYDGLSLFSCVHVDILMRPHWKWRIDTHSYIFLQTGSRSVTVRLRNGSVLVKADPRLIRDYHSDKQNGAQIAARGGLARPFTSTSYKWRWFL